MASESYKMPANRRFAAEERDRAISLYSKHHSLQEVATILGRSPAGVYKVLKDAPVHIESHVKVSQIMKKLILRLYYIETLNAREVGSLVGLSKPTVLYWIKKQESPIDQPLMGMAETKEVLFRSRTIDLLPFVARSDLRFADGTNITLMRANSQKVVLSRFVEASAFGYLVGFYLAEGNKGRGQPGLRNTKESLLMEYVRILRSFVMTPYREYRFPATAERQAQREIRVGGECMKRFLINAIEGVLSFLATAGHAQVSRILDFAFAFLRGCADGDGSVSQGRQKNSQKLRVTFYLTEARTAYATRLKTIFAKFLGSAYLYRPRGRNYYLVQCGVSPNRAARLLSNGFFLHHQEMRRRLATKVLDSRSLRRLFRL